MTFFPVVQESDPKTDPQSDPQSDPKTVYCCLATCWYLDSGFFRPRSLETQILNSETQILVSETQNLVSGTEITALESQILALVAHILASWDPDLSLQGPRLTASA